MTAGYKFFKSGTDYSFFTEYGSAYSVSFSKAGTFFHAHHPVVDFVFRIELVRTLTGPMNRPDILTGITVAEIVNDFFDTDNRNVLFYICDPQDGRIKARQRKFDYWFRSFNTRRFVKLISTIQTPAVSVDAVFIFDQANPFAYDISIIIDQAKDNLNLK